MGLEPHGHDDRDERGRVGRHDHRNTEESHRATGVVERDDLGIHQCPGQGDGSHLIGLEVARRGDGQQNRQEVQGRVACGVKDRVGGGFLFQPPQRGCQGDEGLDQARSRERPHHGVDQG